VAANRQMSIGTAAVVIIAAAPAAATAATVITPAPAVDAALCTPRPPVPPPLPRPTGLRSTPSSGSKRSLIDSWKIEYRAHDPGSAKLS